MAYPIPTSEAVTAVMKGNRKRDTKPEVRLRSALQLSGLRFRKDYTVIAGDVRVRVDIVFPAARIAVFSDGCFWHACPEHGTTPRSNVIYWGPKLARNVERDQQVNEALETAGWSVIRVWEHEPADQASSRIEKAVRSSGGGRHR